MTEDERFELWKLQQGSRRRFRRLLNRKLRGSPDEARRLKRDWDPLIRRDYR